jgi:hypothetical protein
MSSRRFPATRSRRTSTIGASEGSTRNDEGSAIPATARTTGSADQGVLLLCGAVLGGGAVPADAETRILTVGASGNYQYRTVSAAVAVANADPSAGNYYKIRVAPGNYTNDFPVVTRPMTIEVDPSGAGSPVLLKATVPLVVADGEGILAADDPGEFARLSSGCCRTARGEQKWRAEPGLRQKRIIIGRRSWRASTRLSQQRFRNHSREWLARTDLNH